VSTPFRGERFTFTQPDGSEIEVRGWGDQYYAVFETLDGYTIVEDPETGYYHYADLSADGASLEASGGIADHVAPPNLRRPRGLRVAPQAARAMAAAARRPHERKPRWQERREMRREQLNSARASLIPMAPPSEETVGEIVGLCLLIDFPDLQGEIAQDEVSRFCNEVSYAGYGNNGSVRDYFLQASGRRLRYSNTVTAYYTAEEPRSYYTEEAVQQPIRARELIREALDHLKDTNFDFSQLTADSGGYVKALNVFYAGSRVNNWAKGLWPHSYHLGTSFHLTQGRKAFDYQFTDMGPELTLGTFCHENGHMVCDFPDLYDYGYQSEGSGVYCLMCAGGSSRKNPAQVGAYLKYKAGWADSVTPLAEGMSITASAEKNEFFIYSKNDDEYFLIENRWAVGRDASLPSEGLAIWHIDEAGDNDNEQMTAALHYEASVEQADGSFHLENDVNPGDAGDLFSDMTSSAFGDATNPDSRWWDGSPSGLELQSIGSAGATIAFEMAGNEDDVGVVEANSNPGVAIPDANLGGVQDVIQVATSGAIGSVEVDIDISHTYRGDLRVALTSPSGATVVLQERAGGRQDDINRTFDSMSTPGLRFLTGGPIQGSWALGVQDLAPIDEGTLNSWALRIMPRATSEIRLEEFSGETIPDKDPVGMLRVLATEEVGTVADVSVSIDITHTFIRDLVVSLASPSGTVVDLHHRAGGSADNIIQTYTVNTTPELDAIRSEPATGSWTLRVADLEGQDVGKLNYWGLKILLEASR
jgi:M6 family metalloprotease-like protein